MNTKSKIIFYKINYKILRILRFSISLEPINFTIRYIFLLIYYSKYEIKKSVRGPIADNNGWYFSEISTKSKKLLNESYSKYLDQPIFRITKKIFMH